jgi:uncharacterized protein YbjT (DUF2867 family)
MPSSSHESHRSGPIVLTGATGYVGGALRQALEARHLALRCLVRHPEALADRCAPTTQVLQADLLHEETLRTAFDDAEIAYYLVHTMSDAGDFAVADRQAAQNFARAAKSAGVRRLIYLGGIGGDSRSASRHLRSRREVGDILRSSGPQVIEFRSSIILGSGSLSFEMIRALVETLPAMVTPRWVRTPCQPIAITDVLSYLTGALGLAGDGHMVFEIGGADRVSYGDLMAEYARQRGLRRIMIPVPVLTPWLSGLWLALVTPQHYRIGRRLIGGLSTPTVANDADARATFGVSPIGVRQAMAGILQQEAAFPEEAVWSKALPRLPVGREVLETTLSGLLIAAHRRDVPASPEDSFRPIRLIGGARGWYCGSALWRMRGWLDRLVGGPGLRCVRSDPENLRVGDPLDSWRVVLYEPYRRLRLRSELRMPGRAWLDFEVDGGGEKSTIQLTAVFAPRGLTGRLYWRSLRLIHRWMFRKLLERIAARALGHGK